MGAHYSGHLCYRGTSQVMVSIGHSVRLRQKKKIEMSLSMGIYRAVTVRWLVVMATTFPYTTDTSHRELLNITNIPNKLILLGMWYVWCVCVLKCTS